MTGSRTENLLELHDLKMHFPVKEGILLRAAKYNKAVDGVTLSIKPGETLGLVGESGCGKSTLGRCIVNLYRPTAGDIYFEGHEISRLSNREIMPYRQNIQMIFQDPMESLNSRQTVGDILEEPLIIHKIGDAAARKQRVRELLNIVGLPARSVTRFPFEFSGGQRQRIGIARAIALNPKLIICDEAVSALDVSIQSQILNLLIDLQKELDLSYLFIAHDLMTFIRTAGIPTLDPCYRRYRSRIRAVKNSALPWRVMSPHPSTRPRAALFIRAAHTGKAAARAILRRCAQSGRPHTSFPAISTSSSDGPTAALLPSMSCVKNFEYHVSRLVCVFSIEGGSRQQGKA
jgi:ABC-type dipeptide/oligopeptide/nickel transport system ATPase subunit